MAEEKSDQAGGRLAPRVADRTTVVFGPSGAGKMVIAKHVFDLAAERASPARPAEERSLPGREAVLDDCPDRALRADEFERFFCLGRHTTSSLISTTQAPFEPPEYWPAPRPEPK